MTQPPNRPANQMRYPVRSLVTHPGGGTNPAGTGNTPSVNTYPADGQLLLSEVARRGCPDGQLMTGSDRGELRKGLLPPYTTEFGYHSSGGTSDSIRVIFRRVMASGLRRRWRSNHGDSQGRTVR